ncbi:hypothetical protein B0H13DRAFT_2581085 [Mycena leptocephala]|nr:hypothetical protein B0H13DRAFT_2581085 [Mycena leptocephala]
MGGGGVDVRWCRRSSRRHDSAIGEVDGRKQESNQCVHSTATPDTFDGDDRPILGALVHAYPLLCLSSAASAAHSSLLVIVYRTRERSRRSRFVDHSPPWLHILQTAVAPQRRRTSRLRLAIAGSIACIKAAGLGIPVRLSLFYAPHSFVASSFSSIGRHSSIAGRSR